MYDRVEVRVFDPTAVHVKLADALIVVPVIGFSVPSALHRTPVKEEMFGAAYAVTDMVTSWLVDLPRVSVTVAV